MMTTDKRYGPYRDLECLLPPLRMCPTKPLRPSEFHGLVLGLSAGGHTCVIELISYFEHLGSRLLLSCCGPSVSGCYVAAIAWALCILDSAVYYLVWYFIRSGGRVFFGNSSPLVS